MEWAFTIPMAELVLSPQQMKRFLKAEAMLPITLCPSVCAVGHRCSVNTWWLQCETSSLSFEYVLCLQLMKLKGQPAVSLLCWRIKTFYR